MTFIEHLLYTSPYFRHEGYHGDKADKILAFLMKGIPITKTNIL